TRATKPVVSAFERVRRGPTRAGKLGENDRVKPTTTARLPLSTAMPALSSSLSPPMKPQYTSAVPVGLSFATKTSLAPPLYDVSGPTVSGNPVALADSPT